MAGPPKHKLGWSELEVTDCCLGTMTWGRQNTEEEAHAQLDYAIKERGINFIDTAEVYPVPGSSSKNFPKSGREVIGLTEEYIGNWFAKNPGWREKVVIATKIAGYNPNSDSVFPGRKKEYGYRAVNAPEDCQGPLRHKMEDFLAAIEGSLARLQTTYIDLYQLHWPDRYTPRFGPTVYRYENYEKRKADADHVSFTDIVQGIKALLDAGKIKYWGVSNETTFGLCQLVMECDKAGVPRPITIQNEYHLLNRGFDMELAEACAPWNFNIGLLPWSPLAGGALSGKYLDDEGNVTFPERTRFGEFQGYQARFTQPATKAALLRYREIAKKANVNMATLAIAWCNSRDYVRNGGTIIGATNMEQLKTDIDAFEVKLEREVLEEIDEVFKYNRDVGRGV